MNTQERMDALPDDLPDVDIDVCQACGQTYGCTQSLVDRWRQEYRPRNGEIMPQRCWRCL